MTTLQDLVSRCRGLANVVVTLHRTGPTGEALRLMQTAAIWVCKRPRTFLSKQAHSAPLGAAAVSTLWPCVSIEYRSPLRSSHIAPDNCHFRLYQVYNHCYALRKCEGVRPRHLGPQFDRKRLHIRRQTPGNCHTSTKVLPPWALRRMHHFLAPGRVKPKRVPPYTRATAMTALAMSIKTNGSTPLR